MDEQIIINKVEKPNSYEFGKVGDRFKIYFGEVEELEKIIKELKEKGILKEE